MKQKYNKGMKYLWYYNNTFKQYTFPYIEFISGVCAKVGKSLLKEYL